MLQSLCMELHSYIDTHICSFSHFCQMNVLLPEVLPCCQVNIQLNDYDQCPKVRKCYCLKFYEQVLSMIGKYERIAKLQT